jgi:hypothetical protein
VYFSDAQCEVPHVSFATSTRTLTFSGPSSDSQWTVGVANSSGATIYYRAYALCANVD